MFTFRFVLPSFVDTVFQATGGGRVYVHAINVLAGVGTVLDVQGGGTDQAFYNINGMKIDGNVLDYYVLKNTDAGDGRHVFRFSAAHFEEKDGTDVEARVSIDRSGTGASGQSVLEFVRCNWMTLNGQVLTTNVLINGASSTKPSRLIVRDSPIGTAALEPLIQSGSSHHSEHRIENWTFADGVQP